MNEKQLLEIKGRIDQSKSKLLELKGRKEGLMDTLEKTWGCATVRQAEKKLDQLKKDLEELETQKQEGIEKLENKYEF